MKFLPKTWEVAPGGSLAPFAVPAVLVVAMLLAAAGCDRAPAESTALGDDAPASEATPATEGGPTVTINRTVREGERNANALRTAAPETETESESPTKSKTAAAAARPTLPATLSPQERIALRRAARSSTTSVGANIRFERLRHDFGRIWDIDEQQTGFAFTNTGDEELVITSIKASCGCTTPELVKKRYLPGESGEIDVAFKPKGFGRQSKTVTVLSNSARGPSVKLTISSEIVPFVSFDPKRLDLGDVRLGEAHTGRVLLTSQDPSLEVRAVNVSGGGRAHLSASLVPEAAVAALADGDDAAAHMFVEITLADTAPWGPLYGSVDVEVTGHLPDTGETVEHSTRIMVNASVFGELSVNEAMFRVQVVPPGESFEHRIRLSRAGRTAFEVLSAEVSGSTMPGVAVRAEPIASAGGSVYDLVLTGDSGTYMGPIRGKVVVTTDVPGEERIDLDFAGIVREPTK